MNLLKSYCILLALLLSACSAGVQSIHSSDELNEFKQRYGTKAHQRLTAWQRHIHQQTEESDALRVIERVNSYVNRSFRYQKEPEGQSNILNLFEFIAQGSGDCEEFALAKYAGLLTAGFSEEKLNFGYVRELRSKQSHLVVLYKTDEETELVLDNLNPNLMSLDSRSDLKLVVKFKSDQIALFKVDQLKQTTLADRFWSKLVVQLQSGTEVANL